MLLFTRCQRVLPIQKLFFKFLRLGFPWPSKNCRFTPQTHLKTGLQWQILRGNNEHNDYCFSFTQTNIKAVFLICFPFPGELIFFQLYFHQTYSFGQRSCSVRVLQVWPSNFIQTPNLIFFLPKAVKLQVPDTGIPSKAVLASLPPHFGFLLLYRLFALQTFLTLFQVQQNIYKVSFSDFFSASSLPWWKGFQNYLLAIHYHFHVFFFVHPAKQWSSFLLQLPLEMLEISWPCKYTRETEITAFL